MESKIYQKMYENEDKFWWHVGMRKIIESVMDRYSTGRNNNILDVGCGTGGNFKLLSKYGSVSGIDKSEQAVYYASSRNIAKEVVVSDITNLSFSDNTFDVVVCFDVLYHKWVKDDIVVLHELRRILKPGGILIIREASYDWLRSQHDDLVWTNHRFSRQELEFKLKRAGFKVVKNSYINFFLFPVALVKRLLEKIIPEKNPLEHTFSSNKVTNNIFKIFLYIEATLINYLSFPFGLSIICVVKK